MVTRDQIYVSRVLGAVDLAGDSYQREREDILLSNRIESTYEYFVRYLSMIGFGDESKYAKYNARLNESGEARDKGNTGKRRRIYKYTRTCTKVKEV